MFKVGDKVICIDDSPHLSGGNSKMRQNCSLIRNKEYTVTFVYEEGLHRAWAELELDGVNLMWKSTRFKLSSPYASFDLALSQVKQEIDYLLINKDIMDNRNENET